MFILISPSREKLCAGFSSVRHHMQRAFSPLQKRVTVSRVGWGGDGHQVTVSRGRGGGDCKGISRQTLVPSTDASKENTCEATFALMRCQCVSSNTNGTEDPKER